MHAVTVVNLGTELQRVYTLPARDALVAAWEQDRGNWNTWTYTQSACPVVRGRDHLFAEHLAVRLQIQTMEEFALEDF